MPGLGEWLERQQQAAGTTAVAAAEPARGGLGEWLEQQQPTSPTTAPSAAAKPAEGGLGGWVAQQGQVARLPETPVLREAGYEEPEKGMFSTILEVVDAPGNALRGAIHAGVTGSDISDAMWAGLTRDQQFALSDTLKAGGVLADSPIQRAILGFAGDVLLDPLNLVGVGVLTKAGKIAKVAQQSERAARLLGEGTKGIEAGSKVAKALEKLAPEARHLGATAADQARLGQRAMLSLSIPMTEVGVPLWKGGAVFKGMGRVGQMWSGTKTAADVARWSNRLFGTEFLRSAAEKDVLELGRIGHNEFLDHAAKVKSAAKEDRAVFDDVARRLGIDVTDRNRKLTNLWENYELDDALKDGRITDKEHAILKRYRDRSYGQLAELDELGIKISPLDDADHDYVHHLITPDALRAIGKLAPGEDMTAKVGNFFAELKPGFGKQRRWRDMDIEEINAAYKAKHGVDHNLFHTDPALIAAARELSQIKTVSHAKMQGAVRRLFGKTDAELGLGGKTQDEIAEITKDWTPIKEIDGSAGKFRVPREVANALDEVRQASKPRARAAFLRFYDKMQGWWSTWALLPRPAFHFRNMIGNLWNNHLAGVNNISDYATAGLIQAKGADADFMAKAFLSDSGAKYTYQEVLDQAHKLGVIKEGQYTSGISGLERELLPQTGRAKSALQQMPFMPGATQDTNFLLKKGAQLGSLVEGNARLAHFISKLRSGHDPLSAAHSVKKYLFDYQELSAVERNVFKRLMPFYVWQRRNIPLQLKSLFSTPGKFATIQQAKMEIENHYRNQTGIFAEGLLPEWAQKMLPLQLGKDAKDPNVMNALVLGSYLPAADLQKVFEPGELPREFLNMLSPVIKVPIEQAANVDIRKSVDRGEYVPLSPGEQGFMGAKGHVKQEMLGTRWNPRAAHLLRTMVAVNEIDRLNPLGVFGSRSPDEDGLVRLRLDASPTARWAQYWLGTKLYSLDVKKTYNNRKFEHTGKLREIRKEYNWARRRGDQQAMADAKKMEQQENARWIVLQAQYRKAGVR